MFYHYDTFSHLEVFNGIMMNVVLNDSVLQSKHTLVGKLKLPDDGRIFIEFSSNDFTKFLSSVRILFVALLTVQRFEWMIVLLQNTYSAPTCSSETLRVDVERSS